MKRVFKKGFTLVELIAVVAILAIIMAITIPMISNVLSSSKDDLYNVMAKQIESAGKEYLMQYKSDIANLEEYGTGYVTVNELINKGLLEDPIINPKTNEELPNTAIVKIIEKDNGLYNYIFLINGMEESVPVITLIGSNTISIQLGDTYSDEGAIAYDSEDGDITDDIVVTNNVNPNVIGIYEVVYNVVDSEGNVALPVTRKVYVTDGNIPIITMLGSSPVFVNRGQSYSDAGATALDDIDGDISDNIITTSTVNTNIAGYYTVIYNVSDSSGNAANTVVRIVVVVDETAPIITILGNNPVTIEVGSVYSDAGATALDDIDGDLTSEISVVSNVNPNVEGMYTVTYNVSDSSGNAAVAAVRTVKVVQLVHSYSYTGDPQTFSVNVTGTYKIELWGAGAPIPTEYSDYSSDNYVTGGFGAYTKGNINLTAGTTLYVYIGQEGVIGGNAYNGGSSSGGGATDIRTLGGDWDSVSSLRSRIMIAGGGGGVGGAIYPNDYNRYYPRGSNGGLTGGVGQTYYHTDNSLNCASWLFAGGEGGTQTAGGAGGYYQYCNIPSDFVVCNIYGTAPAGTFGIGGAGVGGATGGGGGYYGGGGGYKGSYSSYGGGGAGSSFISGHTGCDAIDSLGNHTGQPNHFSGLVFSSTTIQSGVRSGNGFVTITYIP